MATAPTRAPRKAKGQGRTLPATRKDRVALKRPMDGIVTAASVKMREAVSGARSWEDVRRRLPGARGQISARQRRSTGDAVAQIDLRHRQRFQKLYTNLASEKIPGAVVSRMARQTAEYAGRLPARMDVAMRVRLDRAARNGEPFSPEALRQYVAESVAITRRHARVVSEDQAINLVGEMNKRRQEEAGVRRYVWRTQQDNRVRPTHRANEGEEFLWSKPPAQTGHPGTEINCRCTAEPITPRRRRR